MCNHQDFKDVVIRAKPPNKEDALKNAKRDGFVSVESRVPGYERENSQKLKKIEDQDEDFRHERVNLCVGKKIMQSRSEKKMTRVALANAINIKENILQDYENGKAIPDNGILRKISNCLQIDLRK